MRLTTRGLAALALVFICAPAGAATLPEVPDAPVRVGASQSSDVEVADNEFVPEELTVTVGSTVTWEQTGTNPHSVTASDGSFDSHPNCTPACMTPGETFEHTFEEAGSFPYYCKVHGTPEGQGMAGVITVEATASSGGGSASDPDDADVLGSQASGAPTAPQVSGGEEGPLPVSGGPGASAFLGSGMLVLAAGVQRLTRRR